MHAVHPVYRPDIDGLRAIAVLSVIVFHAFPSVLSGGFVGVDIFFVISGFLISGIIVKSLNQGSFSFAGFYANRIRRIFPALILVLMACYVFGWFALLTDEYEQLGKHIAAGAGFVQNFVLWQETGYFDQVSELKPLMHLWSLAVEEQYYLIYPALIWCVWRTGISVMATVAVLGTLSFVLNVVGIENEAVKTFFLPQTRFWELMVGAALASLQSGKTFMRTSSATRGSEVAIGNLLAGTGVLLITVSVCALEKGKVFPGWWALLPVLGAGLVIFAGPNAWVNRKILANRFMVFVGLISYPLYLWHWPILAFIRIIDVETPPARIRLGALVLSFLLAWLSYKFIERPIRFGSKTWPKTAALCVLMFLVGVVGYNTFQRKGFEFRYQPLALHQPQSLMPAPTFKDRECVKAYPEFATVGFCMRTKLASPDVLLLGDSHAEHLYHGMAAIMLPTSHVLSYMAKSGCPPFFDVVSVEVGEAESCVDFMNSALEFAESTASIKTVVLALRGPLYLYGTGFGNALSEYKMKRSVSLRNRPDITDSKEVIRIATESTIRRLLEKQKQIVFVLDVPELDFDAKSCQESPLGWKRAPRALCAVSRIAFDVRNSEYRALVHAVLERYPAVKVFDAAAELCDAEWCWAEKGNELLYSDTNHLSMRGSEYVAPTLVKLIDQRSN